MSRHVPNFRYRHCGEITTISFYNKEGYFIHRMRNTATTAKMFGVTPRHLQSNLSVALRKKQAIKATINGVKMKLYPRIDPNEDCLNYGFYKGMYVIQFRDMSTGEVVRQVMNCHEGAKVTGMSVSQFTTALNRALARNGGIIYDGQHVKINLKKVVL